jgi:hypothetical protein
MNWIKLWNGHQLVAPCITGRGESAYHIVISKRPSYCDRGDWLISCVGGDLDEQDGFPRYFIGSDDEVKHQMEQWLGRRQAYQNWLQERSTIRA